MAPKSTSLPSAKLAAVLAYIRQSGTAHSIKDLEKALPSVASISSMQVKDYLQSLTDNSLVRVEKIGSGNWYWSFPEEEARKVRACLNAASEERDAIATQVANLQASLAEKQREREDDVADEAGSGGRTLLEETKNNLEKQVRSLQLELAKHSENDPVEIARTAEKAMDFKSKAEMFTDQIFSMEGWIKTRASVDRSTLVQMKRDWYRDEFDEEECGLKELP